METPFAVFLICKVGDKFASTTLRGERFGFPGGKVEPNEDPLDAVIRETNEEGWLISDKSKIKFLLDRVDEYKRLIRWYYTTEVPVALEEYKEKYRNIRPVLKTEEELRSTSMGNPEALNRFNLI